MIKEALQYIVGMKEPTINEINGEKFSDKPLTRISTEHYADEIHMHTLTSLVEYIKSGFDEMKGNMIVHVVSPTVVRLYSTLDHDRDREIVVKVDADIPEFRFGSFMDHESFTIALQSKFIDSDDRALILKFSGTVESGTVASYGDDGISQKATVKTGISSKSDAIVPNPVILRPYRTFHEVEQPASQFIFRMSDRSGEVGCAIFEADGGAWKQTAMESVKSYLKNELKDFDNYIVIS